MKNVQRIIDERGGLTDLMVHPIRIENQPYMRLVIEYIGTGPRGLPCVSVWQPERIPARRCSCSRCERRIAVP